MKHIIAIVALSLSCTAFAAQTTTATPGSKVAKNGYSDDFGRGPSASSGYSYMGSYIHEIDTNMTVGSYTSEKAYKDADTGTNLSLSGAYLHYLKDGIQVGGEASFSSLSKELSGTGDSETIFDLVGVGVYNFQNDLKESIYAKAGIGLYSVLNDDHDGYESKLGFFIGAGKRFPLFPSVTYNPEIRLTKKGDIDMGLSIALINFGIYWN